MVYGESISGKSSALIELNKSLGRPFFARLEMTCMWSFLPVSTIFTPNSSFFYLHFFETFEKYWWITNIDDTENTCIFIKVGFGSFTGIVWASPLLISKIHRHLYLRAVLFYYWDLEVSKVLNYQTSHLAIRFHKSCFLFYSMDFEFLIIQLLSFSLFSM